MDRLQLTLLSALTHVGFILGGALACQLGVGFVPIRKKGKLPFDTFEAIYDLEYGTDALTIHQDAASRQAAAC